MRTTRSRAQEETYSSSSEEEAASSASDSAASKPDEASPASDAQDGISQVMHRHHAWYPMHSVGNVCGVFTLVFDMV